MIQAALSVRNMKLILLSIKGCISTTIQSAFSIDDPEKKRKELYPFSIVNNSFRKIIVTRSEISPFFDDDGIIHVGIVDFLLSDDIFSF